MSDEKTLIKGTRISAYQPRAARASACGKAIIVGEHAVVYGARAVAIPLRQMTVEAELGPLPKRVAKDETISLKLGGKEVSPRVRGVVDDALSLLGIEPFAMAIKGHSTLPIGAGLGSSATLCIVTLRLLAASLGIDIETEDLARLGNKLEARFHGSPSGLDTAVVAHESCIAFAKGEPVRSIPLKGPGSSGSHWHFALIDSGVRASTLAMIKLARPYFTDSRGERRLFRFDSLSETVLGGLRAGDLTTVAQAMHETGELLKEAGVVPEQLDSMLVEVRALGVLAAKTTGAGGGGALLALLAPDRAQEQLDLLRDRFGGTNVFHVSV